MAAMHATDDECMQDVSSIGGLLFPLGKPTYTGVSANCG